jgi:hypothetical protein
MTSDAYLRIAEMTIALHCGSGIDAESVCRFDGPVRRFLVPEGETVAADVTIDVRFGEITAATGEPVFDSGSVWSLFRESSSEFLGVPRSSSGWLGERGAPEELGGTPRNPEEPFTWRIECQSVAFGDGPYKVALFDETFTRGEIVIRPALAVGPLDYPLDEVLLANLLGRGRGVELHSCGVVDRDGRGHLFVGVSGAGKTTTARLWEGEAEAIVSDDRVIVRERDGAMWMYGTPWHGEAELSMQRGAPLAGVYLLAQAETNELRTLSAGEAVARLFGCAFPLFYDAEALDFTVSFLGRLCASVPVRELRFVRDQSVVQLVREAA